MAAAENHLCASRSHQEPAGSVAVGLSRSVHRRSRIPAKVEHVIAAQKHRFALVILTIGMARASAKLAMANLAYNFTCFIWIEGRPAPA